MNRVNNKILFSIFTLLILLVGVLFAVYLSGQEQDPRQRASEGSPPGPNDILIINGDTLTLDELTTIAKEQYANQAIDDAALIATMNFYIEEQLLIGEARRQNIAIAEQDILDEARKTLPEGTEITRVMQDQARVTLLKDAITKKLIRSREAFSVGFWLQPDNYGDPLTPAQQATLNSQRQLKNQVLTEIETQLVNNGLPIEIATSLATKYPLLKDLLTVNGHLVSQLDDTNRDLFTSPVVYEIDDVSANTDFYKTLVSAGNNQVKRVTDNPRANTGGIVIKTTASTNGNFIDYESWLADTVKKNVTFIEPK